MGNLQLEYKHAKIEVAVATEMFGVTPFLLEVSHQYIQESAMLTNILIRHVCCITNTTKIFN
jgi:hypothetical protein